MGVHSGFGRLERRVEQLSLEGIALEEGEQRMSIMPTDSSPAPQAIVQSSVCRWASVRCRF
jgi:hypothetical protein